MALSSGRIIERPLNLLIPVEVSGENHDVSENYTGQQQLSSPNENETVRQPVRIAAQHAKLKIAQSCSE